MTLEQRAEKLLEALNDCITSHEEIDFASGYELIVVALVAAWGEGHANGLSVGRMSERLLNAEMAWRHENQGANK